MSGDETEGRDQSHDPPIQEAPPRRSTSEPPSRKRPASRNSMPALEDVQTQGWFSRLMNTLDCCSCRILDTVLGPESAERGKERSREVWDVNSQEVLYEYEENPEPEETIHYVEEDAEETGNAQEEQSFPLYGESAKVTGDSYEEYGATHS